MNVRIIGAGMAGLLAGAMLRYRDPKIYEAQPELPNNHSAVLRFRSSRVGDVLNIPFRKVSMLKTVAPWMNPVADALAYSRKCTGINRNDRSITSANPELIERFIAPEDLIARMASRAGPIAFNCRIASKDEFQMGEGPIISTLPMPALMKYLEYPNAPEFKYVHGFNLRAKVANTDAFVTCYIPNPALAFNRLSITGDELIAEYSFPGIHYEELPRAIAGLDSYVETRRALQLLGMQEAATDITMRPQRFSKMLPIPDDERKRFIAWATDNFNIFSLGRFATWRPGLLLDDLVNDVILIDRWLSDANGYEIKKHR